MATKKAQPATPVPGSAEAWAQNIAARWRHERDQAPELPEETPGAGEEES